MAILSPVLRKKFPKITDKCTSTFVLDKKTQIKLSR